MEFSPLETALISILVAMVASWAVWFKLIKDMEAKFVQRNECELEHKGVQNSGASVSDELAKMNRKQDLLFDMTRAMILVLDIPREEKTKILNMRRD